jgi:hypothetical protein
MSVPLWIIQALLKPTIRNDSIEICTSYFSDIPISLNEYDCVCVGIGTNKLKYFTLLKILSCESNIPLHGPHNVRVYNHITHTVDDLYTPSLTSLKKKTFHYIDRLSFERSTYLILYSYQKIIRLKNIRGIISLPCSTIPPIPKSLIQKTISKRTYQQTATLLRTILTAFQRDLHGEPNEYILQQFENILLNHIKEIQDLIL